MRYPIFKLHFLLIAVDLSHLLPKDTENMSTDAPDLRSPVPRDHLRTPPLTSWLGPRTLDVARPTLRHDDHGGRIRRVSGTCGIGGWEDDASDVLLGTWCRTVRVTQLVASNNTAQIHER
jgi:hypothetical protein